MKLSFENNYIVLQGLNGLKKYQISQLEYYGYVKNEDVAKKKSVALESDVFKLLEYLREENVSVEVALAAEVTELLNKASLNKNKIARIFEVAKDIKEGKFDLQKFGEFRAFLDSLPRKLKQHQIKSAFHLYTLKNGANFSVPGSGKTSVVLSVFEKFRNEGQCNLLFVIGPPSCFQPWKNEFEETLGRVPNSIILSGSKKTLRKAEYYKSSAGIYELYLTTFQTLLHDYQDIIKFLSQRSIKAFVVIDEAHYMKQIGGSWANALININREAIFKCVLTGTPMPKSYRDIYNLFDFLWNQESPINETVKIQIDIWEKQKKNDNAKQLLQTKIGPLFYRVRKKDLGLMEPCYHEPILIKMNNYEEKVYKYAKARIFELTEDDYFKNEEILNKLWKGRMMRLRQAISYPKLLTTAISDYEERFVQDSELKEILNNYDQLEAPGKLQKLIEMVYDFREKRQKVLIWSNFIGTLELLRAHFLKLNIRCELIYGKTPIRNSDDDEMKEEKTREDIRDEFVDLESGLDVLIANPAACAESISLHKTCFHAIYYDLSYNAAQYIQSLDRIHRVGGSESNKANYYFLQYINSLDQDIKKNLEAKASRMYDLIEQDYTIYDLDLYDDSLNDDIGAYKRLFLTHK